MPKCPQCDTVVEKSASACPNCGIKFRRKATVDEPEEVEDFEDEDDDIPARSRKMARGKKGGGKKNSNTMLLLIIGLMAVPLVCCIPILIALLLPAVQQARDAARLTQALGHMKQIGLGAHNFLDVNGQFPPRGATQFGNMPAGQVDPNIVPQSFFTDILPYIDQAALQAQIQYSRPWSDEANKVPLATVIPTYLHPSITSAPVNGQGYALAHFATNRKLISDTMTHRVLDITDGLSNTMMAGSLNDGFKAWGDPSNHRDPASGFGGGPESFGAPNKRFAIILLCDGSVRRVPVTLDPDICAKLADPQGGQPTPNF